MFLYVKVVIYYISVTFPTSFLFKNADPKTQKIAGDGRHYQFIFGPHRYPAVLTDLPCLIEAQKTFDNISYYKAADVAQVGAPMFIRSAYLSKLLILGY